MIHTVIAVEPAGPAYVGIVDGMPAGLSITTAYINHQVRRLHAASRLNPKPQSNFPSVELLSGMRSGRTLGSPIALFVRDRARQTSVEAILVACCTIARKFLEDFGIFIGSHVTRVGTVAIRDRSRIDDMILRYTKASCGAYKVTEQADLSPVRILDETYEDRIRAQAGRRKNIARPAGGTFELLVTGAPAGLAGGMGTGGSLPEFLNRALRSIPGVQSVRIRSGFRGVESYTFKAATQRGATDGKIILVSATTKATSRTGGDLLKASQEIRKVVRGSAKARAFSSVPAASVLAEAVIAPVLANAFLDRVGGNTVRQIRSRYGRFDR